MESKRLTSNEKTWMEIEKLYLISDEHRSLFIPVIDAFEMSKKEFKRKYRSERLKRIDIYEICHALETQISKLVLTPGGRSLASKLFAGIEKILNKRSEIANNEIKRILKKCKTLINIQSKIDESMSDERCQPLDVLFDELPGTNVIEVSENDANKQNENQIEKVEKVNRFAVPSTPSKRKPENSDKPETPSKRKRIEDGTSHDTEVLANSYPDDIDFGNFSQDMQQALPEITITAPKSPLENDKEKAGTSLTQSPVELHDDDWFLPPLELDVDTVKKHRKLKKKQMSLIDEEKQIRLDVSNIYAHTVPMSKRIMDPKKFVVPASQLLSMPSTSHARNTCRLISRVLLGRFEYATKEVLQKDSVEVGSEIRRSEPQSFSSRPKSPSDLRGFVPNDDHALSPMDDLPQNDFSLPTHQLTNNPQEPAIEGDDFTWTKDFIYQSIIQLCQGGVKIQLRDLAPIAETKRENRVLAFVFILEFVEDEKIYIDQSDETQTIYIWLREN